MKEGGDTSCIPAFFMKTESFGGYEEWIYSSTNRLEYLYRTYPYMNQSSRCNPIYIPLEEGCL